MGIQESVQVDTLIVDVLPGDLFMLCSDGLHGYLNDDEVAPLAASTPVKDLPDRFVALANERGGKDNITTVVVACSGDPEATNEEIAEAQSRMEALKRIPLFRHLTYKEQTAVLSIASTRTFPAGREIVTENQAGRRALRGDPRAGGGREGGCADRRAARRRPLRRDGAHRQRPSLGHRASHRADAGDGHRSRRS